MIEFVIFISSSDRIESKLNCSVRTIQAIEYVIFRLSSDRIGSDRLERQRSWEGEDRVRGNERQCSWNKKAEFVGRRE